MSTAATTPGPESRAFVDLAHQLLAVLRADAPDAATALNFLAHPSHGACRSSTAATTPGPESRAFVDLAHQLLAVLRADAPDAATALNFLAHPSHGACR